MRQSWMAARRGAVLPEAAGTTAASRAPCRTNALPGLKRALRNEVHVWLVEPAAWLRAFGHDGLILSADERSAADAFTLEPLRQRYRIAHCAVRRLLSLYADAAPGLDCLVRLYQGPRSSSSLERPPCCRKAQSLCLQFA